MAAAIPTLNEITYGVASRIPYYREGKQSHNVHPGTPEAESLFEQYTKQIAESANNVSLPLVEFVLSQGDRILHFLIEGEERDRGEDMIRTILSESSSASAGDAARWLVIVHKSKQLLQVATTIAGHRGATTVEYTDIDDALYWLELRATSASHDLGVLEGDFDQDGDWLPPPEEVEEEEIRLEEELDQAEEAALDTARASSEEDGEGEDADQQGEENTSEGTTEKEIAQGASAVEEVQAPSAQEPDTARLGAGGSSSEGGTKRKGSSACDVPAVGPRAPLSTLSNSDSDGKKKAKRQ